MSTVRIPAKKTMEPGMSLLDIDNIWDYIDMYVEEDSKVSETNMWTASLAYLNDEYDEDGDDWDDCDDDSWGDYDGSYMEDNDWESDYRDAFEDDPEATWGRVW
jgi:hypothetical protein